MKKNYKNRVFTLFLIFTLFTSLSGYANQIAEKGSATIKLSQVIKEKVVTIDVKNSSLDDILNAFTQQTSIGYAYEGITVDKSEKFTLNIKEKSLESALNKLFDGKPYEYKLKEDIILIKKKEITEQPQTQKEIRIKGRVVDASNKPIVGATIIVLDGSGKGALTDDKGDFALDLKSGDKIEVSFLGMKTIEKTLTSSDDNLVITMELSDEKMGEVVVTGIVNRRAESFTGSSTTLTAKDLKRVGNQNILQALKNLDPSLYIMDNIDMGSNPNALPEMQMRGASSLDQGLETELRGNYQNQPNQPLFIVDGFESSIEKVFDLDMNRVESVTLLKDASAKAIYGSKAANGVVVIETRSLLGTETRVTYTGSIDITAPDLSSYNLATAAQKLEAELIEGVYTNENFLDSQVELWQQYEERAKLIRDGLDTYWLSKPLSTGVGHKHNLSIEVGDAKALRAIIDFSYNNVDGVMTGSDRTNIQGNVSLSYRYKDFLFRNTMTIIENTSFDSPYGDFYQYTQLNPYYRAVDNETGEYTKWADDNTPNPLYDSVIGTLYQQTYMNVTNNFYAEWAINDNFKLTGRLGIDMKRSDSDTFLPAEHSTFRDGYYNVETSLNRGSYTYESGKSSGYSMDLNLSYNKNFGKHFVFFNAGTAVSDKSSEAVQTMAIGFPSNMGADLQFARQYPSDGRPITQASLIRELSFLAVASYSYDDRYFADLTYRISASSLYGSDDRWAPGWSIGAGWNIHNESFLKDSKVIEQLKFRTSIGLTGNQNFNTNQTITTYQYYNDATYQGMIGAYMTSLANPYLTWEQRQDFNIGLDAKIGRVTGRFDYYNGVTQNMVADISVVASTGFERVKDNLGKVRNRGFELQFGYTVLQSRDGFLNISASAVTEKNTIIELSEGMRNYNEQQLAIASELDQSKPVLMYNDGQAMNTIWAVPSLGIDPATGDEVYVKQDGSVTTVWDASDMVAAGVSDPLYRGNISISGEYKGFGLNVTGSFLGGNEMYNQTLVDRVENIDIYSQVDARVLLGRWQYPGQEAQFKRLTGYNEKTQSTTRFVQKRNEFNLASVQLYYDFQNELLNKTPFHRLRLSLYMNDALKYSSIEIERGLSYPFARTFSFSVTATF